MICHITKKHGAPEPDYIFKCKLCYQEFPGFNALRKHKNTQHGCRIKQMLIRTTISSTKLMMQILEKSCANVNFSLYFLKLNLNRESQHKFCGRKA